MLVEIIDKRVKDEEGGLGVGIGVPGGVKLGEVDEAEGVWGVADELGGVGMMKEPGGRIGVGVCGVELGVLGDRENLVLGRGGRYSTGGGTMSECNGARKNVWMGCRVLCDGGENGSVRV